VYQNMSTLAFFTSRTIRKNQLLRPFPEMSSLIQSNAAVGDVRTHDLEVSLERRFSKGISFFAAYTRSYAQTADIFLNEYDTAPSSRESNFARPHRFVFTGIWELPFGHGRAFAQHGFANWIFGGWQLGGAYEAQPGPLLDFGNLFYNGDISQIDTGVRTFDRWFNTANFERVAARGPAAFQSRVFPTRIDGLRADYTNCINSTLQRDFRGTTTGCFRRWAQRCCASRSCSASMHARGPSGGSSLSSRARLEILDASSPTRSKFWEIFITTAIIRRLLASGALASNWMDSSSTSISNWSMTLSLSRTRRARS